MEAAYSFETPRNIYQTTRWRKITEDSILYIHSHDKLEIHFVLLFQPWYRLTIATEYFFTTALLCLLFFFSWNLHIY